MKAVLTAIVGAGVVLAVSGLAFTKAFTGQAPAATSSKVTGPSERVEFTSVLSRSVSGRPLQTGRFFRAADGSERHEVGPSVDVVTFVQIKNISQEAEYVWDSRNPNEWNAHPMQLAGLGLGFPKAMPAGRFTPNPSVTLQVEGFAAVERTKDGLVERLVPALNFLVADRLTPSGERMTHSNIQVGPVAQTVTQLPAVQQGPPRDPLFGPPPSATLKWSTTPGGIIVTKVK